MYGSVTSLNGEPEPGVYIEAVGVGSPQCEGLQEDSKTEQDATYRVRGLQVRRGQEQYSKWLVAANGGGEGGSKH